MKSRLLDNDIILIGNDGRNELGILREFGEWGIIPYMIIIEPKWREWFPLMKSKYATRYKFFQMDSACEDKMMHFLMKDFYTDKNKPIIITTTDIACEMVDRHVVELSEKYIVPNIGGRGG